MSSLIAEITARQDALRHVVMEKSNRALSALALANVAIAHRGDGAHAAAELLLAMEHGKAFDFRLLLQFDTTNRAHADMMMMGYQAPHLWPSIWLDNIGAKGEEIMQAIVEKWG